MFSLCDFLQSFLHQNSVPQGFNFLLRGKKIPEKRVPGEGKPGIALGVTFQDTLDALRQKVSLATSALKSSRRAQGP